MIVFTVWQSEHQYRGFSFEGHAEYAEAGSDLVCAAVSVLALNTVNSIETFTEDSFRQELSEDGGYLKMEFPDTVSEKSSLLMDSLVLGIRSIQAEYGEKYITLTFEEV
ncbi:MAG: ribosomal-processing cysteine protease Prp [Lachnospiraceae bacterium]|nr:ribosomal-processing cysteine protease Prp [Lachnospiraceae bacterium]